MRPFHHITLQIYKKNATLNIKLYQLCIKELPSQLSLITQSRMAVKPASNEIIHNCQQLSKKSAVNSALEADEVALVEHSIRLEVVNLSQILETDAK